MFSPDISNRGLFEKIKLLSNKKRFKIIELTQIRKMSVTELSKQLNLAYTKCADYVTMLEKKGLVEKTKSGKEKKVKSRVQLKNLQL